MMAQPVEGHLSQLDGAGGEGGDGLGGVGGEGVSEKELHAEQVPAALQASNVLCRPEQSSRDKRVETLKADAEMQ